MSCECEQWCCAALRRDSGRRKRPILGRHAFNASPRSCGSRPLTNHEKCLHSHCHLCSLGVLILGTAPLRMIAGGISIATGIVYLVMSVYPGSPRPQPLTGWTWCTGEPEEPVVPSAAENGRHSGGRTNLQINSPSSVISASGQAKDPNPFVPTPHQAAIRAEQAGQADGGATFTVDVGPALSGSNPFTN